MYGTSTLMLAACRAVRWEEEEREIAGLIEEDEPEVAWLKASMVADATATCVLLMVRYKGEEARQGEEERSESWSSDTMRIRQHTLCIECTGAYK